MQLSLKEIIECCSVKIVSELDASVTNQIIIDNIMFDSRRQNVGKSTLFLSLGKGELYVEEARKKGVTIFMIPRLPKTQKKNEIYLVCKSVLDELQKLASALRSKSAAQYIGITGSNGKTITKEWVYTMLKDTYKCGKSPASYNSQLGVPLSVIGIEKGVDIAIIEAGISKNDEMSTLQSIVKPTIGILTTIGDAHSEGFSSLQEKIKEKLILFKESKKVIYEINDLVQKIIIKELKGVELITWSREQKEGSYFVKVNNNDQNSNIIISGKNSAEFNFFLQDNASISNVIHTIILALELNLSQDIIQKQLKKIRPISMRLELIKAPHDCLLINDSYNSDLTSLHNALEFAITQKNNRNLTLILSEFDDQINDREFFDKLNRLINSYPINKLYFVGENNKNISCNIVFNKSSDLLNHLIKNKPQSELILIKGARRFKFESIANYLQENQHRTILQTNLLSIGRNLKFFKSLGKARHKIMAVLKAGAYGSDSVRIAKYIESAGIDYLAVAFIEEGIELRKEGVLKPIMIMNPDPSLFSLAIEYNLELEIFSLDQLKKIDSSIDARIHIIVDSGMNRLGFKWDQVEELIRFLNLNKNIKVQSIFSHLSSADDLEKKEISINQNNLFNNVYNKISKGIKNKPSQHICNSYGSIHFPEMHYDMIRVGIGMHGLIEHAELECSHRLVSFVAQVKDIQEGESVGYNQGFIAAKNMTIATVSIGYADGISRKHGHGNSSFYINGNRFKTIGNVSMDATIIDVTGASISQGDEVVIFENRKQFFDLCKVGDVIPYEFLCGIGKRVARNSNLD